MLVGDHGEELYDLEADPGENVNLARERPELVESGGTPPVADLSPESLRELEALGYLE